LLFTFEIKNIGTANLGYSGWPGIGSQLGGGIRPGVSRKFRADRDQLAAAISHLDRAVEAGSIELVILNELSSEHIKFLVDLQSDALDQLLTNNAIRSPTRVFVSHAAADKDRALLLAAEVERRLEGSRVFVASRPGDIRPGSEWFETIKEELRQADAYIVVVTSSSVERPWVIFETGAAWMSEKPVILASAAGFEAANLDEPLSFWQVYSLETVEEARLVFDQIGAADNELGPFCEAMRQLPAIDVDRTGRIKYGDSYLAWTSVAMQLLGEVQGIPATDDMIAALRSAEEIDDLEFALPGDLIRLAGKGLVPVYETDLRSYRRPLLLTNGEGMLVVRLRPPAELGSASAKVE
jgi:hypothetical protein